MFYAGYVKRECITDTVLVYIVVDEEKSLLLFTFLCANLTNITNIKHNEGKSRLELHLQRNPILLRGMMEH